MKSRFSNESAMALEREEVRSEGRRDRANIGRNE
jgi:hypothetical protein